ncbi:MAG TPA: retropepsin-like aspartic protease, partial [Pirellulales bacterium]
FRARSPYRLEGPVELRPVPRASSEQDSVPAELCAIAARVNGIEMPTVFIDTGAQHTLLTAGAAREAGVKLGAVSTHLVGFAGLEAQPGVIESLQVGELTLHDVPVLVGQSVPLVATGGQLTLGLDIMHHLRFTIDYPAGQVFVQPAREPAATDKKSWTIGVWTFPQACLCNVNVKNASGRAIIDTGDRRGTFVSSRWARRNLTGYRAADASLIFKFKPRDLVIEELELGTRMLSNWPVVDTFPNSLDRLDVADVLLGHDLLSSYVLTIDVLGRELRLRESTYTPPDTAAISTDNLRQTGADAE